MTLEFPHPPSLNHYWRHVGSRTLISRQGRAFRADVATLLVVQKAKPLTGPLDVYIQVWHPDARRRDIDNLLKSLLDAMQHGGLYADDSQIERLAIERRGVDAPGRVVVNVQEIVF